MTKDERNDLKKALIEALNSQEGQEAIVGALNSGIGQEAIKKGTLEAFESKEGQKAIKNGALRALESEEGKKVFSDLFIGNFKEVVVPAFENHEDRIIRLENQQLAA
jgi:hypothetical protein